MSNVLIIIAIVCLLLLFMGLVGWQYVNLTKSVVVIDVSLSDNKKIDEEGNAAAPAAARAAAPTAAPAAARDCNGNHSKCKDCIVKKVEGKCNHSCGNAGKKNWVYKQVQAQAYGGKSCSAVYGNESRGEDSCSMPSCGTKTVTTKDWKVMEIPKEPVVDNRQPPLPQPPTDTEWHRADRPYSQLLVEPAAPTITPEQQCNDLKSSSTCTNNTACKWNDRYFTGCSGNGRLGDDCAYFKNVVNNSDKCSKAAGCTVRKKRTGRIVVYDGCDGHQKGEDNNEIICDGRGLDRCDAASPHCQSNFHPAECILWTSGQQEREKEVAMKVAEAMRKNLEEAAKKLEEARAASSVPASGTRRSGR